MNVREARKSWRSGLAALLRGSRSGTFRLTHYFIVTSLVAFAAVALALYFLERAEQKFFEGVQREQSAFLAQVQAEFVREQKEAARGNLLMVHEAGHVTLTNLFANALWETHLAPLVAKTQRFPLERCRRPGRNGNAGQSGGEAMARCFADLGRQIRSLPGFAAVDAAVHAMMKKSTVFKIKSTTCAGSPFIPPN